MNSTKSDYQNINLIVQSITTKEEKDYTYVTLDGFKDLPSPAQFVLLMERGRLQRSFLRELKIEGRLSRNGFIFAKGTELLLQWSSFVRLFYFQIYGSKVVC